MALPYRIATLLYCFNTADEVLLLERVKEPDRGLWSPPGGKLIQEVGESPHQCGCREALEEAGLELRPSDLHLTGTVTEVGYAGEAHWLLFLFEVKIRLRELPATCDEGRFQFYSAAAIPSLPIPRTDREQIWPLFWKHRGGFFAAHCHSHPEAKDDWDLEESHPELRR